MPAAKGSARTDARVGLKLNLHGRGMERGTYSLYTFSHFIWLHTNQYKIGRRECTLMSYLLTNWDRQADSQAQVSIGMHALPKMGFLDIVDMP
jgi:hypothetical protein